MRFPTKGPPSISICLPPIYFYKKFYFLLPTYYTPPTKLTTTDSAQMPVVDIEPSKEHPMPYDMTDDTTATLLEEMAVAGNTVELQHALGADFPAMGDEDIAREKALIDAVVKSQTKHGKNIAHENLKIPTVAFAAAAFLRTYGEIVAMDAAKARAAITNKLMEIANCGETKYELKALELLGKHSDIGIFTERSEVTINYRNPEDLEFAIKERVKRLLNADVIDITPLTANLDEELGVFVNIVEPEKAEDPVETEVIEATA
jgi:hypothetical protein